MAGIYHAQTQTSHERQDYSLLLLLYILVTTFFLSHKKTPRKDNLTGSKEQAKRENV